MSYKFRPYDQDQIHLLPESLDDWVSQDSFARFLSEVVYLLWDNGKLKGFCETRNKSGKGGAAFHPALMLKLLLFCYCQGVMSSMEIAQGVCCNQQAQTPAIRHRSPIENILDVPISLKFGFLLTDPAARCW